MARTKKAYRTTSRENYLHFCERYPDIQVPFKKWVQVQKACNWMYIEHALHTGEAVRLPYGFGILAVSRRKTLTYVEKNGEKKLRLPVDWKKTREEGYLVYNMNFHTSGWRYKWKWFSQAARLRERHIWALRPCRLASRAIARYVTKPYYAQLYKEWKSGYYT